MIIQWNLVPSTLGEEDSLYRKDSLKIIISHSNNTSEEDNLSIVDKMAGPKVSFIQ